jgi:uncharacterized membrane protein
MSIPSKLAGVGFGAMLMYFFDPIRGRKRRARAVDAAVHLRRRESELLGKAARDAEHRARGLAQRVRQRSDPNADDDVLEGRVRARLGRIASHPRALEISVRDGRALLRGPILAREADAVLASVRGVRGVREVVDDLARCATAGSISSLQGEGRSRRAGSTWTPALQVGAIGAGALLAGYGLVARRGMFGAVLGSVGGALLARGLTNRPLRLGGRHVAIQKTLTVRAPIDLVHAVWTRLEDFPRFMQHVHRVEVNGKRSRWTVDSYPGATVTFEAEITHQRPNLIAWRTLPDQPLAHEGTARFEATPGGTRIHVEMSYRPSGGVFGHAIARVLGFDPKRRLDEDLIRMKALLEEGHTRAHGQRFELAKLH